jgi:IS1 family transposase
MEITKQTDLIEKVSAHYRPYIEALRTPDLKSKDSATNLFEILQALIQTTALTGKINEDKNVDKFICEQFYEQIKVKYPHARHGEISLAFKKGALGEYGEYFGINVTTCWKWWKSYIESKELIEAKREWVNLMEMPRHDPDVKPLNLNESMKEPILNAFKDFKETGRLPYTAASFYNVICQLKGVKTLIGNVELRNQIKKEAFDNYRESLVQKGTNRKDPKTFQELLDWCTKPKMNPTYEKETRKLALKYYFKECQLMNKEPI